MMSHVKSTLAVSALFVLIAAVTAVWLYPVLPAQVPMHWDLQGNVNGTMPRFWAAAFPALSVLGLALLTAILPVISPHRFEIAPFASVYNLLMLVVQGVILFIGVSALLLGAGYAVPMPTVAALAIGVLFMVLGNYMGKLRKNFFIGIRTPWTLASSAVWERTHRLGGRVFVLAGLLLVIGSLAGVPLWVTLSVVVTAALIPCVYSYVIYRQAGSGV
ncbi:MAG: SdpI family protein [Rhodanobacter sp.]